MTAEEIRQSESGENRVGNEVSFWLREIAAQLAEANAIERDGLRLRHNLQYREAARLGK